MININTVGIFFLRERDGGIGPVNRGTSPAGGALVLTGLSQHGPHVPGMPVSFFVYGEVENAFCDGADTQLMVPSQQLEGFTGFKCSGPLDLPGAT